MRRLFWTAGVGFTGFLIGGIGWLYTGSFVGLIWGASIGWGFGSIFSQTHASKRVIAYWAGTLALVGPFFSLIIGAPYTSLFHEAAVAAIGALVGMLMGFLVGALQFWVARRRHHSSDSETAVGT